jgi:hypothetical protein
MNGVKKASHKVSQIAGALAKERWRRVSPKERSEIASELSRIRWEHATDEDREAARERLAEARKKRWPTESDGKKTRKK